MLFFIGGNNLVLLIGLRLGFGWREVRVVEGV